MMKHKAGTKLREWREGHRPRLTREEAALRLGEGFSAQQIRRWEEEGRLPRLEAAHRLHQLAICEFGDWFMPAEPVARLAGSARA